MLTVAIASESGYDGEVFRLLAERVLRTPIKRWETEIAFQGWPSVGKRAPLLLTRAAKAQVRYAILAVDNDGYADTRREHSDDHEFSTEAIGCRECWLQTCIPAVWTESGGQHCIAVPVQTLETWLLHVRGFPELTPSPEKVYDRRDLKVRFFGRPDPSMQAKIAMAAEVLAKPNALDRLRERPSFRRFEERLKAWKL